MEQEYLHMLVIHSAKLCFYLLIYLFIISRLSCTQEYLTYTTAIRLMVGGKQRRTQGKNTVIHRLLPELPRI